MKSVLIVEDEKLIRQGIRTMIQRSGVPVDLIMECANGEMALETVKNQDIEVMFTDIRMPKMDGIELVRRIHEEVEHPPIIVAISGYDDFAYAVEMMRNGVREYILKPVEREKIVEVLNMLERELSQKEAHYQKERKIGINQIRHVFTDEVSSEEMTLLSQKYEKAFFPESYVVVCAGASCEIADRDSYFLVPDMEEGVVVVVSESDLFAFLRNELGENCIGISNPHRGIAELRPAYEEALCARKKAFCIGAGKQLTYEKLKEMPPMREELRASGERFLAENARMQRMQRIGTDKTEELATLWEKFFTTAEKGYIEPEELIQEMRSFLAEAKRFYRNSFLDEDEESVKRLSRIMCYETLDEYEEDFSSWLMEFHERINQKDDEDKNQQKIEQAIAFIRENFKSDLNMAVVSNHISMNYTMFSYSFKQYTGKNFTAFLKEVRVNEAKRLLEETDLKIIDISGEVGYENEKNFMKVFKSVCGVSPSEYRKNVLR